MGYRGYDHAEQAARVYWHLLAVPGCSNYELARVLGFGYVSGLGRRYVNKSIILTALLELAAAGCVRKAEIRWPSPSGVKTIWFAIDRQPVTARNATYEL